MSVPRRRTGDQLHLLEWEAPKPVARFQDEQVRAASISARICRGVSLALKETQFSRDDIAARMSDYLGQKVSRHVLDAYASQGREDHVINVVRFVAMLHATQDRRLLEMIAELFGWTVIERRFLRLIELASLQERQDELRRRADVARRQAKSEGLL